MAWSYQVPQVLTEITDQLFFHVLFDLNLIKALQLARHIGGKKRYKDNLTSKKRLNMENDKAKNWSPNRKLLWLMIIELFYNNGLNEI